MERKSDTATARAVENERRSRGGPSSTGDFGRLLTRARQNGASEVYLHSGMYPLVRERGTIRALSDEFDVLTPREIESLIAGWIPDDAVDGLMSEREASFWSPVDSVGGAHVEIALALDGWRVTAVFD